MATVTNAFRQPLSAYDLSRCDSILGSVCGPLSSGPNGSLSDSTLSGRSIDLSGGNIISAFGGVPCFEGGEVPSLGQMTSAPNPPLPIGPDLALIKAFRLQGNVNTIKKSVCDNFSGELVEGAKKALWDQCGSILRAVSLPFHICRDSEKHTQLSANLEDILKAFEVLDGTGSIPSIFCEASDLPRLPPVSLDPVCEQVWSNTHTLSAAVSSGVEDNTSWIR